MSTSPTGPSATQPVGAQASGAPLSAGPTGPPAAPSVAASSTPSSPTGTTATFKWPESWSTAYLSTAGSLWLLFLFIWAIAFHAGAALLSYRRYGSGVWAIVNFFFAAFYYPYYALALDSPPAPAPAPLIGGVKKLLGMGRRR